jgi:hypothetical protein
MFTPDPGSGFFHPGSLIWIFFNPDPDPQRQIDKEFKEV